MAKKNSGPSLYYATDKNIFDALSLSKVDATSLAQVFLARNTIVSTKTPREDLARYFATLSHDLSDHEKISRCLGVVARRERVTTVGLRGAISDETVEQTVETIRKTIEAEGDSVHVTKKGDGFVVEVQYSAVDYSRTELSQVQVKDGTIEIVKAPEGYVIRSTQNEHIGAIRDTVVANIEKGTDSAIAKEAISLFDIVTPHLRTKFFSRLMNELKDLKRIDVTDVFVYKPRPPSAEGGGTEDVHVDRVAVRGRGVSQSKLVDDLLTKDTYYIVKAAWISAETSMAGSAYEVEAAFQDVRDCKGFSYLVKRVYPIDKGVIGSQYRAPSKLESHAISKLVESAAATIANELRNGLGLE